MSTEGVYRFVVNVPRTTRKKIGQIIKTFSRIAHEVGGLVHNSNLNIVWMEDDDGSQRFSSVVHNSYMASGEIRISSRDPRVTQTAALAVYLEVAAPQIKNK